METQPWRSQVDPTIEDTVEVGADETETANTETRDAALDAKEGDKEEQAPPSNDVEEKEQTSKQPDTFAVEENTEQEKVENEVAAGNNNETSTTKPAGQKRLIIQKQKDYIPKLSMTNIFAKSTPRQKARRMQRMALICKANLRWM